MRIEPALVGGDDVVADLGQRHRLAVGGKAPQDEGKQDRAADPGDEVGAPVGEGLVDDRLHDPGGKRRGAGDDDEAEDCEDVAANVIAPVLRNDALQNARDRFGTDVTIGTVLFAQ